VAKKTDKRLVILGIALLCIIAVLFLAGYGLRLAPCPGSSDHRAIESLERRLDEQGKRIDEAIRDAADAAGSLAARERECLEGHRELADKAREIADGLGSLRDDAAAADGCLEELGSLIEELQRRSDEEHP